MLIEIFCELTYHSCVHHAHYTIIMFVWCVTSYKFGVIVNNVQIELAFPIQGVVEGLQVHCET